MYNPTIMNSHMATFKYHMTIQQYNPTVVSHSIYIVCVLCLLTVLVSDVNPPYQMMLAVSTEAVKPPGVQPPTINPPTTMSSL